MDTPANGDSWRAVALPRACPERRRRPPVRLGKGARRILAAIGEVVAPTRDLGFDPRAHTVAFVEAYLPYLPPLLARLFPLGLRVLELAPLFVIGRPVRASSLAREERARFLRRLGHARLQPVRELWKAVRGLVACGIYNRPEVHAALGYAPQPFIDAMVAHRRERFGAPEPW